MSNTNEGGRSESLGWSRDGGSERQRNREFRPWRRFWVFVAALSMIAGAVLLKADSLCLVFDGIGNYVELDNGADSVVVNVTNFVPRSWPPRKAA